MNPLASGNKTISGLSGIILVTIVTQILKKYNIEDANGVLTAQIVGYLSMGGLFIAGVIHKLIKKFGKKS